MVSPIQGSTSGFDLARKLAISGSSDVSLVRGLGSGAGLSKASEVLLAGVSKSLGELAAAQETIQSRIQEEGGLELAKKLAPQLVAQNIVGTLVGGGGLSFREQASLVTVGLKSLGGTRGSGINLLA